jgi:hypothetical protein
MNLYHSFLLVILLLCAAGIHGYSCPLHPFARLCPRRLPSVGYRRDDVEAQASF